METFKVGNIYECLDNGSTCCYYDEFFKDFGLDIKDYRYKTSLDVSLWQHYELVYITKRNQNKKDYLKNRIFGVFRSVETGQDYIVDLVEASEEKRTHFIFVKAKNKLVVEMW